MTSSDFAASDPHHDFSRVVTGKRWLAKLERRARNAKISDFDHLHNSYMWVHIVTTERLDWPDSLVADSHLCGLLAGSAELHWTTTEAGA